VAQTDMCKKLQKILPALYRRAFDRDLTAELAERGQELWFLGLDTKNERYLDLCGSIKLADLSIIQAKGYIDADAGYLANAHLKLSVPGKKFDLFMLNTVHFGKNADFLEPIIVHELAHLLEHLGLTPSPKGNDDANAEAILRVLDRRLLSWHPKIWALHLAAGGRTLIEKRLTQHKTIRAFLEAAVPIYDRMGEPILAKKQP
jgi:hypothetical protein